MAIRERIERLERIVPREIPPCSAVVATRVLGIYIEKCGLNPSDFSGPLDFVFPGHERRSTPQDWQGVNQEEEDFFQANLANAVLWHEGHSSGKW